MSTLRVDTITDEAGTGAVDFPNGLTGDGSALTGIDTAPPTTYQAVGTYTVAWYLQDISSDPAYSYFSLSAGSTYSGASLRIGVSGGLNAFDTAFYSNPPAQALSGTWRAVSGGQYASKSAAYTAYWYPILFVRIS